jgi:transcriptional regulator with XRE-family HTH domain
MGWIEMLLYLKMSKTLYTEAGLRQLAEIIKSARQHRSLRDFEAVTGVSHATIARLERCEVSNPEDNTLSLIAPHTSYSLEELKAIAQERERGEIRKYRLAEDVLPIVDELPRREIARLAQIIVGKLGGIEG